jgi:predicted transcriptional regulator
VGRKKKNRDERRLTDLELELMQVLWDRGEATVKDVASALPKERPLAYTSVATILKVLENKKYVASRKTDRAHTYSPLFTREEYQTNSVTDLLGRVFRSGPSRLVLHLLQDGQFSAEELENIRSLLEERQKK